MKRIFIPTQSAAHWQRLLAEPELHWKPGRSAMTAAACWEAAGNKLPPEISTLLESSKQPALVGLKLVAAFPEWEVSLPVGSRSSFAGILTVTRNELGLCVIAVEAKAEEDFGPTLGEKLTQPSAGQSLRMDYLHRLLGVPQFEPGIRYQLLHRTASAVLAAGEFHAPNAVMMIQSWTATPEQHIDFESFCKAMGAESLPGGIKVVQRLKGPRLFLGWCDVGKQFLDNEPRQ